MITVENGGERITSTEGTSADEVREQIAALDAAATKEQPAAATPPPATDNKADAAAAPLKDGDTWDATETGPKPAIEQDREPDGTFKKGGKKDAQSRIAHLTWSQKETERQLAAERAERERIQKEWDDYKAKTATPEPPKPAQTAPNGRPSEDEVGTTYPTYADYVEALADWKFEQRQTKLREQEQQTAAQKEQATLQAKFQERSKAWIDAHPDKYQEYLSAMPKEDMRLPDPIWHAILHSERGPDLLHFLVTHPEECLQLVADAQDLPPTAAPWVRRTLESKLADPAASPGPAPAVSRSPVPAPIQPVGASPVVSEPDTSLLDGKAFVEAENARELRRYKQRLGLT